MDIEWNRLPGESLPVASFKASAPGLSRPHLPAFAPSRRAPPMPAAALTSRVPAHSMWSLLVALSLLVISPAALADAYDTPRRALVQEVAFQARYAEQTLGRPNFDPTVLAVMAKVPRHEFVPSSERPRAYANRPLPIGHGQTISQPFIVALMTDMLGVDRRSTVLEVGTGSGYQAAVLAELVKQVYTVEIIEPLARDAAPRLTRLGYANVEVRLGDGYYGWPEKGPFDAIIVTAAASHIPPPLVKQLRPGGRMVIPLGSAFLTQQLTLVDKLPDGSLRTREVLPVSFVPLTGGR